MNGLAIRVESGAERHEQWVTAQASIGRDPACDVVLASRAVSRKHLVVELRGDQLWLADQSANGTWLPNGELLRQRGCLVATDSSVQVGPYRLRFTADASVAAIPSVAARDPKLITLRRQVHRKLLDHLDLAQLEPGAIDADQLRPKVRAALELICHQLELAPSGGAWPEGGLTTANRERLIAELCDEVLGLGPLEALLADEQINEIMVIDPDTIFVERAGRIERAPLAFTDDSSVRAVIERIVTPLGRRIDASNPLVDARLPDGSRVNAVIPPLATRGACITIRKFSRTPFGFQDLVAKGSLDERVARFLQRAVAARRNILVAGGTGSGKTTLLNVLSSAIGPHERVITIEDAAELRLSQPHVVSLEARPPNAEGRGEVTIRDLLKNALRMRPDRILVGECRAGEAIDMLQAMNTGHEGSMTTTHANSPREAIARLETLCLMSGLELPLAAVRGQIATSIHLIVQQARLADGRRRITHVSEVCGLDDAGEVVVADIFELRADSLRDADAVLCSTGYLPRCLHDFAQRGLSDDGALL